MRQKGKSVSAAQLDLFDADPLPPPAPPLVLEPPEPESELGLELALEMRPPDPAPGQSALFATEALAPVEAPKGPYKMMYVHFENLAYLEPFGRLIGQPVTSETRFLEFPIGEHHFQSWRASAPPPESLDDDDPLRFQGDPSQANLFGHGEWWEEDWRGMPEFVQPDQSPKYSILIAFATKANVEAFAKLMEQKISHTEGRYTRSLWYPEAEEVSKLDKRYIHVGRDDARNPRYPIFVISKGRADTRLTSKALEYMKVPYRIAVEPQEYDQYAAVIDPKKIIVTPFSNLGLGSIPVRNFIWDVAEKEGHPFHWCLDDNIAGFYRLNRNMKLYVESGAMFNAAERFVDRYENVGIAGFQYWMFAPRKNKLPPFALNTRIYSCILIRNELPYRWRGKYNEDTDLSLRALKDGWSTVLFYAFIADKVSTMTMKGGNTDELYAGTNKGAKEDDGRWKMAESLRLQHPDVTTITWKWGRWQHHVDYTSFRVNRLRLREDAEIKNEVDDFGMQFIKDETI